jgi:hypothetical protein
VRFRDETQEFLAFTAKGVKKQLDFADKLKYDEIEQKRKDDEISSNLVNYLNLPKVKQADIAVIYKVSQMQSMSFTYLRRRSRNALLHCAKRDEVFFSIKIPFLLKIFFKAYNFCLIWARKSLSYTQFQKESLDALICRANKAVEFCTLKDNVLVSLIRTGLNSFGYLALKAEAKDFLYFIGRRCLQFLDKKEEIKKSLVNIGQKKLNWANERERAVTYLNTRKINASKLVILQNEAVKNLFNLFRIGKNSFSDYIFAKAA